MVFELILVLVFAVAVWKIADNCREAFRPMTSEDRFKFVVSTTPLPPLEDSVEVEAYQVTVQRRFSWHEENNRWTY